MARHPIVVGDTWELDGRDVTVLRVAAPEYVDLAVHAESRRCTVAYSRLWAHGRRVLSALGQCDVWEKSRTVLQETALVGPGYGTADDRWRVWTWNRANRAKASLLRERDGHVITLPHATVTTSFTPDAAARANDFHIGDKVRVRVNDHIEVGRLVKVDPPSDENSWTTWYHVDTDEVDGDVPRIVTRELLPAVPKAEEQGQPDAFAVGDRVLVRTDTGLRPGHIRRIVPPRAASSPSACGPLYHVADEEGFVVLHVKEDALLRPQNQGTIELLPFDERVSGLFEEYAYSMFQVVFPDGPAVSCESVHALYSYFCRRCGSSTTGPLPALPCERCLAVSEAAFGARHLPAAMAQAIASLPPDDELVPALRRIDDTLRAALDIGQCGCVRQEKLEVVLDEARFAIAVAAEACVATRWQRHGQRFLAQLEIAGGGAHAALMAGRRGLAAPRPPAARTPSPQPLVVCDHGWNDDDSGIEW